MHFDWPTEQPKFAVIVSVHDGDTFAVDMDLGHHVGLNRYDVRLAGCNAHELSSAKCHAIGCTVGPVSGPHEPGLAATENLKAILAPGKQIVMATIKDYTFASEFVARVFLDEVDIVKKLLAEQWLAPWNGRGSRPVPPWPRTGVQA